MCFADFRQQAVGLHTNRLIPEDEVLSLRPALVGGRNHVADELASRELLRLSGVELDGEAAVRGGLRVVFNELVLAELVGRAVIRVLLLFRIKGRAVIGSTPATSNATSDLGNAIVLGIPRTKASPVQAFTKGTERLDLLVTLADATSVPVFGYA